MTTTVLLVEGSEEYREFIAGYFKLREFDVVTCTTYKEAQIALMKRHYDIVITDFFCNGIDGEAFCRKVQSPESQPTALIIMSDRQNSAIEKRARLLSPAFYFIKPFSIENLYAVALRIRGYLDKKDLKMRGEVSFAH